MSCDAKNAASGLRSLCMASSQSLHIGQHELRVSPSLAHLWQREFLSFFDVARHLTAAVADP